MAIKKAYLVQSIRVYNDLNQQQHTDIVQATMLSQRTHLHLVSRGSFNEA